jgi:dihydrofolate reductase
MTSKLIYLAMGSLDGYIEDREGKFDWAAPDEEVHQFVNDIVRPVGTYLYGRRMYETMKGWQSEYGVASDPPVTRDFAEVWRAADKVVYSTTLKEVSTPKTRLERSFDPTALRALKARAERDLAIGGAELAAHAFRAGLIDEVHVIIAPIIVGGGKSAFPADVRLKLNLVSERRFEASRAVHLHYRA